MKAFTTTLMITLILSLFAAKSVAQIYQVINEDGSVTFSDQQPFEGNAQEVEIGETIIQPSVVVPSNPLVSSQTQAEPNTKSVRIHLPADESVLHGSDNRLVISVSVSPAIAEGEFLQLFQNGQSVGPKQRSGQWNLQQLNPGTHKFSVHLLAANNSLVGQSSTLTLYVIL